MGTGNAGNIFQKSESHYKTKVLLLSLYTISIILVFIYLLIIIWPNYTQGENGEMILQDDFRLFGQQISSEQRYLLLVIMSSALGSCIHALTSWVSYVGNKTLVLSWAWWYIARPFIGVPLALLFYFVVRGGLLSTGTETSDVSAFGVAAIAGLVGMFSKQATDKLSEVFETLFRTKEGEGDDARKDKLGEAYSVSEKMIPVNKITAYIIPEGQEPEIIKIKELYALLNETVTRIPVFDHKLVLKFIIHQSFIFKFIFEKSKEASAMGSSINIENLTLGDFLNHPGMREIVSEAVAFISKDSVILNAKEAMESIVNCQDVFITETGSRDEPVIGWLTNSDIGRCLTS